MNVAEFILSIIQKLGTDTVFTIVGGMAMHINRAVGESDMQVIYCNHEQAAAAAADGYAKAKEHNIAGLVVVTAGPGVMNTVNSVASAYYDSVPMFILAGQVKTADINKFGVRSRGVTETPHLELLSPITKCAFRYIPERVSDEVLAQNMAQALAGRKGPIFIDIPLDIQPQQVKDAETRLATIMKGIHAMIEAEAALTGDAAAQITAELARASRPAVVIGNGLRIAGVSRERILKLIENIGAPALFTSASLDLVEFEHDLNFGCAGGLASTHANKVMQSADLLIFFGTRLDLLTTAFNPQNYGKNAKRLVIECDQKEIDKNTEMKNTVFFRENVANVVKALEVNIPRTGSVVEWLDSCRALRAADRREEHKAFASEKLTTYQMGDILAKSPVGHYLVPTASGFGIECVARFYKPQKGASFAWAGHVLGSMGLGLPCAIGAAAALHRRVVCLEGDGGILLNVQELFTLAANPQLKLTLVIMSNGGYQSIARGQVKAFGKEFGATAASGRCDVRFDLLAALVGMSYIKCETIAQFKEALAQEEKFGRRLIEVVLEDDGYRGPSVTTKFDAQGKPYSTDISDVTWDR